MYKSIPGDDEMKLNRDEQETVIIFNEADEIATVFTCNGKLRRKLESLSPQEGAQLLSADENSVTYSVPKGWVKISVARKLTEERRQMLSERAKSIFSAKSTVIT